MYLPLLAEMSWPGAFALTAIVAAGAWVYVKTLDQVQ